MLVTTGLRDELPDVPGLRERWARDVLHCPYCHGWEVRDQPLGVLWNGPDSVRYAQIVRQWADDVVLFVPAGSPHQRRPRGTSWPEPSAIVEGPIARLVIEDDRLTGIELDRRALRPAGCAVRAADVSCRTAGCSLASAAELDEQGWVVTGQSGATSVPGVWAAGNVANPRAQVITAAGEGSAAAIAINADLVDEDVRDAVHDFNQGFLP